MKTNGVASAVLFVNQLFLTPAKISDRKYVVELFPMGCLLASFQWLSWKYRLNLLRHDPKLLSISVLIFIK
jgi:hypothetical protein